MATQRDDETTPPQQATPPSKEQGHGKETGSFTETFFDPGLLGHEQERSLRTYTESLSEISQKRVRHPAVSEERTGRLSGSDGGRGRR